MFNVEALTVRNLITDLKYDLLKVVSRCSRSAGLIEYSILLKDLNIYPTPHKNNTSEEHFQAN